MNKIDYTNNVKELFNDRRKYRILLEETHKSFENIPPFRPIVDTIGTTHKVGKYLCELLNPLASNEFTLKDSFDAADRI